MKLGKCWMLAGALSVAAAMPSSALACGGFFCSQSPVDQSSERIIFSINDDGTTDMIVQIVYQGSSEDFAWLLPLANVPDADKLATFPQLAMMALDSGTGPQFQLHPDCYEYYGEAAGGDGSDGTGGFADAGAGPGEEPPVSVYIRETVGPYDVAVIGSESAKATSDWLQTNGYRISDAMNEYVKLYTAEGMKFLALKLTDEADVSEIAPFRMRLPGDSPSIPLRLTSIAAMPEMGIATWIFGNQRYEPVAPAKEIEIDSAKLRWQGWEGNTNWVALVARTVDEVEGKGWVVEQAGSTTELESLIVSQELTADDPRYEAQAALKELIRGKTYMTRLYTRLSPEEMTYDPMFKRSDKDDVARMRQLPYVKELCDVDWNNDTLDPCDFGACGAFGLCRSVDGPDGVKVAACACAPGMTARAIPSADGYSQPSTSCIDERLSFLNPGDRDLQDNVLPDPCVGFSCGAHGKCVVMNMTPTCECAQNYVAKSTLDPSGSGRTLMECVEPDEAIPSGFYAQRLPPRDLPMGREVHVVEVKTGDGGLCSVGFGGSRALASGLSLGLLGLVAAVRRRRRV